MGTEGWRKDTEALDMLATYCIDDDTLRTIERTSAGDRSISYSESRIAYVLKTGANWAAPIGDFHLTVDKGAPDNLSSFCADRVKKTGATQFEVHRTSFKTSEIKRRKILRQSPGSIEPRDKPMSLTPLRSCSAILSGSPNGS